MTLLDVVHSGFDVVDSGFNVVWDDGFAWPAWLTPPPGYKLFLEDVFHASNPVYAAATPTNGVPPDPAKWGAPAPYTYVDPVAGNSITDPAYSYIDGSKLIIRAGLNPGTTTDYKNNRRNGAVRTGDNRHVTGWSMTTGLSMELPSPGWLHVRAKPSTVRGIMSDCVVWGGLPFTGESPTSWRHNAEIDMFEIRGSYPDRINFATHTWTDWAAPDNDLGQGGEESGFAPGVYHDFVAWWGRTWARIYCDGVLKVNRNLRGAGGDPPDPRPVYAHPTLLFLRCWVASANDDETSNGLEWAGELGTDWSTLLEQDPDLPAGMLGTHMEVEFVRFYTQGAHDGGAII